MNVNQIFKDSWRITWRHWRLWLLTLVMFAAFVPSMLLTAGFGSLVLLSSMPLAISQYPLLEPLRHLPFGLWLVILALSLLIMVLSTTVSWILQSAAMIGAATAADNGSFTLKQSLSLGRNRLISITKLSLTFGVLIAVLGILPAAIIVFYPDTQAAASLVNLAQSGLAPLNSALGLLVLLVMMSVALEDAKPVAACSRAWSIFKSAWWLFLVIILISLGSGLVVSVVSMPMVLLSILLVSFQQSFLLLYACAGVTLPAALFVLVFTGVFTLVLYTLTYQASAALSTTVTETSPLPA